MTQGFTRDIDITSLPNVSSGAGAPASTPSKVGDIYVDTTAKRRYTACGTSSSADWKKDAVFASGTITVTAGGGDKTITLPWDWTDGYLEIHKSVAATTDYFEDAAVAQGAYILYTSYIALTSASYNAAQVAFEYNTNGNGAAAKTTAETAWPKSATSTTFVLNDSGSNTQYVKWFVWA